MPAKSIFKSKTFWFNVLGLAATVAGFFGLDLGLDEETQTQIAVGIMAVGNVVLRLVTRQPVTL